MQTQASISIWRKGTRWALCLGFSAALLYLALRGTDFRQVLEDLENTHPAPAIVAILFLFLSFLVRAWRWRYLLLPIRLIPIRPLFRSTLIGFMGNYLLPLHGGEVVRAVSIGQTQNISKSGAFGSIVLERALDGITLSLTPFLLIAVLDLPSWVLQVNLAFLAVYVVVLSIVVAATVHGWADVWMKRLMGLFPWSITVRLGPVVGQFFQGMQGLNRAGALLPVSVLSLLCWFCHGMYYFLLFEALDLNLSVWAALVLQVVIAIGVILPAGPGYVGNFEYFSMLGLALFGVAKDEALAYSLLAHICQLIPVITIGFLLAVRGGFWPQGETKQASLLTSSRNSQTSCLGSLEDVP